MSNTNSDLYKQFYAEELKEQLAAKRVKDLETVLNYLKAQESMHKRGIYASGLIPPYFVVILLPLVRKELESLR